MHVKVTYHHFNTQEGKDGARCYYSEVSSLLGDSSFNQQIGQVRPHDFLQLMKSWQENQLSTLGPLESEDALVCNCGPYGHLHAYLRECSGASYRIVRDVQTSTWCGFWLQEALAGPMTRERDLVLFPSEFCRQYYIRIFQHLTNQNTAVCHPIGESINRRRHLAPRQRDDRIHVGYIGRITPEKNIGQVFQIVRRLLREFPQKVHLHLAGAVNEYSFWKGQKSLVKQYLQSSGVPEEYVTYYGSIPRQNVWDFYQQINVLLFPSTSCVESLGRVILEASSAGVPVVAANYAAAPELLPANNIVKTRYHLGTQYRSDRMFSFAYIDEHDAIERVLSAVADDSSYLKSPYQADALHKVLTDQMEDTARQLSSAVSRFIDCITLSAMPIFSYDEAKDLCATLLEYFCRYHDRGVAWTWRVLAEGIKYPGLLGYINLRLQDPLMMGHANQHCGFAGFVPTITLNPRMDDDHLLWPA